MLGLILKEGMALASIGLLIGFLGSFAVGRLIRGMWYGIGSLDPLAFSAVAAVLTISVLFACYVPARHAMRVDLVTALRQD